ncbi:DUF5703 family protein [Paeniglutamicibacter sp. NPDC091659]|uniref:DUF5703 family protein n=1 Tax=Paeniglutamicibacter sp. NPDC091659 TaxID=3364389 RepID=UPI0037FD6F9C
MIEKIIPPQQIIAGSPDAATQRYEYLVITTLPHEQRSMVRGALREHAEYGKWELMRSCLYQGGGQKYWMRRRVMRVTPTLNIRA